MKEGRTLAQLNSKAKITAKFVKKDTVEKTKANPQNKLETITVAAKKATPTVIINPHNKIVFNEASVSEYGLSGKNLTIANVGGLNYLVLTNNTEYSGLVFRNGNSKKGFTNADSKTFTATEFVDELRKMENGWSNNFLLEKVEVEVPQVTEVVSVFVVKLDIA